MAQQHFPGGYDLTQISISHFISTHGILEEACIDSRGGSDHIDQRVIATRTSTLSEGDYDIPKMSVPHRW